MATITHSKPPAGMPEVAKVDTLIDETGAPINVPDNSSLRATTDIERQFGAAGPANWTRMGLIGVVIVAFILLMLQIFQGAPGTDVQSGSPVAEPLVEPVTPAQ